MPVPRVLVAEDSPLALKMIERTLAGAGYAVLTARDGLEAIEKAIAEDADLVILDAMMPRMNGYQACRLLKTEAMTRSVPVVILTSKDDVGRSGLAAVAADGSVHLVVRGLGANTGTTVYEAWVIDSTGPIAVGGFTVGADGIGYLTTPPSPGAPPSRSASAFSGRNPSTRCSTPPAPTASP